MVFVENVPGHLRLGFREVAGELREMGYRVAAGIFSALEVGAPHRRERLFALAVADSDRVQWEMEEPPGGGHRMSGADAAGAGQAMADTNRLGGSEVSGSAEGGGSQPEHDREHVGHSDGAGPQGCSGTDGECADIVPAWPPGPADHEDWAGVLRARPELAPATEPSLRDVADGLAYSARLRILGNGVVPLVAAHAFRTLLAALVRDEGGRP